MKSHSSNTVAAILLALTVACSSGGGNSSSDTVTTSTQTAKLFPSGVSIASPLNTSSASASISQALKHQAATTLGSTLQTSIDTLLAATDIEDCKVDLSDAFTTQSETVSCYGPQIQYANHSDQTQTSEETGSLPPGDVGIWAESESNTGEACSAAELNAQMTSMEAKTAMAMKALASMICVANNSATGLPTSGASVDLTTVMSGAVDSSTVSINNATLALASADSIDAYTYALDVSITANSTTYDVTFNMTHRNLDESSGEFDGRLTYQFNDTMSGGNCSGDITRAGSILYAKDADGNISTRSDEGTFCTADDTPFTSDGVLDPTYKHDGSTTGGWGNNYSVLIANYDPDTSIGSYSYAWQAGPQDNYSRTFNIAIDTNENDQLSAESYYGFAKDVGDTNFDGAIDGFICNWAGPGNNKTVSDFVQHQTLHEESGVFVSDSADIGYAPTNDCTYDVANDTDGFIFSYDLDGNGTIDSEEEITIQDGITNDLLEITSMSFTTPTAPTNF